MKKNIVIFAAVIATLAGAVLLGLLYSTLAQQKQDANAEGLAVATYVSQHITELSPEQAVLGGKFYVTEVHADAGKGTVSYEDGHIALTADFTYTVGGDKTIAIDSFTVRGQQ